MSDYQPTHGQALLARVLAGILSAGLVAGVLMAIGLAIASRSPETGSNMVLIGLAPLSGVMMLLAAALLAVRFTIGRSITPAEQTVILWLAAAALLPCILLFALG
jgi:hypothetical protein